MDIKTHKIMEMEESKRERLINAAMSEFRAGYAKASTDAIVREAGISKGLLFHYFGTKEKLYDFLVAYATDTFINDFFSLLNFDQTDLLERIWQMLLLKMDLSYKYPAIFDFIGVAYAREGSSFDLFTSKYLSAQTDPMELLTRGVDKTVFRDDLDADIVVNIVRWAVIGYSNSQIDVNKNIDDYRLEFDKYLDDISSYFDVFRKAFYK